MRARPHWVRDHDQDPYASVQMSGGPTRVSSSDPDPDFEPRPIGFVWTEPARTAEDLERDAVIDRLASAEVLTLHQVTKGRWLLVGHELVAICDQDPDEWGDQA